MTIDPAPCMDCGADTTPCTNKRGCRHIGRWDWYMVWPAIWRAATGPATEGFLCIPCLEKRLGRQLTSADFTSAMVNGSSPWDTARLAEAKARPAPRPVRRFRAVVVSDKRKQPPII